MKLRIRDSLPRRRFWFLTAATCGGLLAGAGCGGSTSGNNNGTGDAGASETGAPESGVTTDAAASDGAGHLEGSVVEPDGSLSGCPTPGPQGTQLATSTAQLVLSGVTSDGYAVYSDPASYTVFAVPVAGGTPVTVGMVDASQYVYVAGRGVFFSSKYSTMTGAGTFAFWTAAGGAHVLSTDAAVGVGDIAADGSYVAYIDGASTPSGTLMVMSGDGAKKMQLATGIAVSSGAFVQFSGPNVIAAYSPVASVDAGAADGGAADGGGGPGFTVATFTGASFTQAVLSANADFSFAANPSGGPVLVSGPAGLVAYPITGGTGTPIDGTAVGGSGIGVLGQGGLLTKDGNNVVYAVAGGLLRRSPVSAPAPVTLVPSGINGVLALSPDESWALSFQSQILDMSTGTYLSDVYLASASTPGAASPLLTVTSGAVYGSAFTADSKYALFFSGNSNFVGDFVVAAAGASSTPKTVAQNAWLVAATTGSKVILGDSYSMSGGVNGTVDLESVDVSNPTGKTTIVAQADANFALTPASDKLVYTYGCGQGANAGVWVMPVP
jgi:hypothetical protein